MDPSKSINYSNDEITIVWKPSKCIHSTRCWKGEAGLSQVFDPRSKPWIKPYAASTDEIIKRVDNCPSGALSYFRKNEMANTKISEPQVKVETVLNGPLLVKGPITLKHHSGATEDHSSVTAFCRCGKSANKPFCDGSHSKNQFE
jgi:uncharacterized Fe-S cluster protein YjdI